MKMQNGTLMTAASNGVRGLRRIGAGSALVLALALAAHAQPGDFRDGPPGGPGGPGGHGGPGGPGMGMGMGMEFNPRMLRELHLSADQEKKLKEGKLAAQKKKLQLHTDKSVLELDLKNILSTYPVNKVEALKFADKISEVDKKLTTLRVESMVALLSGLTAEQHAKLLDIQEEWHEKRKAWMDEMRKNGKGGREGKGGRDGKDGGKDGGRGGPAAHD